LNKLVTFCLACSLTFTSAPLPTVLKHGIE
jgi:hypothetical protein